MFLLYLRGHKHQEMNTVTINQTWAFNAPAKNVYNLLTDAELLEIITGSAAEFENYVDGEFSLFEGYCEGFNLEMEPNKKLVQEWNFAEDGWPEDHYSICTFLFEEKDGKTELIFTQTDVPEEVKEALEQGWNEYFWEPMTDYLEQHS